MDPRREHIGERKAKREEWRQSTRAAPAGIEWGQQGQAVPEVPP